MEPVVASLPCSMPALIASCITPLQQVLKGRLALIAPSLWCGTFSYEEGEGLEEDEVCCTHTCIAVPP